MAKRSEFAVFLNTGTTLSPTWSLIGDKVSTATINYNPQTSEEVYINMDTGNTDVESYKPTLPIEASLGEDDTALAAIETMRRARPVLADAVKEILMVYLYDTPVSGEYPAEKQDVSVQIDSYGGDGGGKVKLGFTLNFQGDAETGGTYNPTTGTYTAPA